MIALIAVLLAVVNAPYVPPSYACDGVTAAYTVNFPFQTSTDLVVTTTTIAGVPTTLALTTDYTVSVTSTQTTATLTLLSPGTKCPSGNVLKITRNTALTQPTAFRQQTKFGPETVESMADRTEMQIQQVNDKVTVVGGVASTAYVDAAINATLTGGTVVQPITWGLVGDGTTITFSIPNAVINSPDLYFVTIDGIVQRPAQDYTVSVSPAQIAFITAPALNSVISVRSIGYAKALSVGDATSVLAAGTSVPRTLAARFGDVFNVKDFGAIGNNVNDDTVAINSAIAAAVASHTFSACVYLPAGRYLVTDKIKMWNVAGAATADGLCMYGDGPLATIIESNFTDITKGAIEMHGAQMRLENLAVDLLNDHLAGIVYDGGAPGRSTGGLLNNLHVNCQNHKGNGLNATSGQADLIQSNNFLVENCSVMGAAVYTNNDNVLTLSFYHPFFNRNTFGVWTGSSSDVFLYGAEIDATDVIVRRDGGNVFGWFGGRAEGPKRIYWDPSGANTTGNTFSAVRFDSLNLVRPAATFSVTAGQNAVTASVAGYVFGDQVVLPGAGAAGATIRVRITGMVDQTHWSFPGSATTTVSGGTLGFFGYNLGGTRCTVATTNAANTAVFSSPFCAVPGDFIVINDCSDPTTPVTINSNQISTCNADGFTCTMAGVSNATNAAACWYLNSGPTTSWQPQTAWHFQGIGPYVVSGNSFGTTGTTGVAAAVASTTGVFFDQNLYAVDIGNRNPFATTDPIRGQFVLHNMFAGTINQSSVVTIDKQLEVTYSASITPDAYLCNVCTITANNGTAFTINNPLNAHDGMRLKFIIRNTSGGALGVITWGAAFKMAAFTSPANANSRSVEFTYNTLRAVWVQNYQSAADVPN